MELENTENTENTVLTYKELLTRNYELEEILRNRSNREYKSRLFAFIFGREENKLWTLALYNAINGTTHTNPDDITINTIEDVVYLGMKNDLSILVSEIVTLYKKIELYEQQSSFNPNMPVRGFMYAAKLYDKFIYMSKFNRYGKKLIPLPIPKLVVFYNGEDKKEDEVILKLSDAFRAEIERCVLAQNENLTKKQLAKEVDEIYKKSDPDIEVKVRMINVNYGHNKELLALCKPLDEYSWFISKIRNNNNNMEIEVAIDKAIDEMPDSFLIKDFIVSNRAEVMDMCLTEYNETEVMTLFKEEGREEGRNQGLKEGRSQGLKEGRNQGLKEGRNQGENIKLITMVCKKIKKGKNVEEIADDLDEEISVIENIFNAAKGTAPEYDVNKIYEILNL